MGQVTIRGLDEDLEARLERVAQERKLSLDKAALLLLRRGAGLSEKVAETPRIGSSLDGFIGSWESEREQEVLSAIEVFERIDEDLWR